MFKVQAGPVDRFVASLDTAPRPQVYPRQDRGGLGPERCLCRPAGRVECDLIAASRFVWNWSSRGTKRAARQISARRGSIRVEVGRVGFEAARGRDEKSDRTLTHSPRAMNQCKTGTLPSPWLLEIKDAKLTGLPSEKFTLVM